jgi:hypothetical protein
MLKSILPSKNFGCGIFMNIYSPFFMYKFDEKIYTKYKDLDYKEEDRILLKKPGSPKLTRSYSWSF